jgi:hypothetical protein
MAALAPLRLIASVEAGTTSGAQLETLLADAGRLAEFRVLLDDRGQVRRMASAQTTIDAFILSPIVINAVFGMATAKSSSAAQAMTEKPAAVASIALNLAALTTAEGNTVAWDFLTASASYEVNSKNATATLAGVVPPSFATIELLIANAVARNAVSTSRIAMRALVPSPAGMTAMAADTTGMSEIANNPLSMGVVAGNANAMSKVAASAVAMAEITPIQSAMQAVSISSVALVAVNGNAAAWTAFKASPHFSTYAADIAHLLSVVPAGAAPTAAGTYASLNSIIDNVDALTLVAANTGAVEALASSSTALAYLASHANFSIVAGSATAMAVLGPDTAAMTAFLNVSAAVPVLFASSIAKGYIVTSTALVDLIAATPSTITYLQTLAVTAIPASLRSSTSAADDPFDPIQKALVLSARANNIGAIDATYSFDGSTAAGTGATADVGLRGSASVTWVYGYVAPTWTVAGIAVTAAVSPEWTYVDMS